MAVSIYPSFATAILSVAPLITLDGVTAWSYKAPSTIADLNTDGTLASATSITGYIIPNQMDKAQMALALATVYLADWYFLGVKATSIAPRGILFKTSINRAFRIAGEPETNLGFCVAPLEPCEVPT